MEFHIVSMPGDGIGPEILTQAIAVLHKVGAKYGHQFHFTEAPIGGVGIEAAGDPLPPSSLEACLQSDSVLLGAVGGYQWDQLDPKIRPEQGLLRLRKGMELYTNLRPAILFAALRDACPLKPEIIGDGFDICVVRELTGGIYFGERGYKEGLLGNAAYDVEMYSEGEVRRIAEQAFAIAMKRRKKVTSVDKANVLESSRFWRRIMEDAARNYPEVSLEHMYVDNASMQLIRDPGQFDVLVTTNMFGDILSDEAGMLTGSIGMLPSASLGNTSRGLYEPIHGSAPDIAGQDTANPIATILSAAMMLKYSFHLTAESDAIERAVKETIQRVRTVDIMAPGLTRVGTEEMGRHIAACI
jgi:3-isopropylmalate dehydrogenase